MNWLLIGVVALNLSFSTLSDIAAKYWGITNNNTWLYIGLVLNLPTVFFYMNAIRLGGLAITTPVILLLTIIISVTLGYLMFRESVTASQWLGIGIGIFSILLISGLLKPLK
jgi:drug/metabolite transporter (DMT)-like permease